MAPHKEVDNKQPPEKWALAFITQSRLCHEDWLIPPGEKVPLEDGKSYLETTLIAVQICESSSVPTVRILQPRGDFIGLNKSLSDTQVDERFRAAPYLHESSVVVRSRIAPYGGSGFFAGDITGWRDYRSRPLSVGSVRNLFDRSHSRYRMQDPESEGTQAYIWSLLESEEKFGPSTAVSGAKYQLESSYKPLPYPDFLHLTCEDYKAMGDKKKKNALAVPTPTDLQYSLKLRASSPVYAKQTGYSLKEHSDPRMCEGVLEESQQICLDQGLFSTSGRLLSKMAYKYLYPEIHIKYVDSVYGLDQLAAQRACEYVNGGVTGGL
jgi:hypothetical protein